MPTPLNSMMASRYLRRTAEDAVHPPAQGPTAIGQMKDIGAERRRYQLINIEGDGILPEMLD